MSKLTDNEQTKLSAAYANGVAVAVMAAGVIAPVISAFTATSSAPAWQLGLIFLCCLFVSASLHYAARLMPAELIE